MQRVHRVAAHEAAPGRASARHAAAIPSAHDSTLYAVDEGEAPGAERSASLRAVHQSLDRGRQPGDVVVADDVPVPARAHQVGAAADLVRDDDRQREVHRLVDHEPPGLVRNRGQDEQIRCHVGGRDLRLVEEPGDADARNVARPRLHVGAERSVADEQEPAPPPLAHACEGVDEEQRLLLRDQLPAEQDDRGVVRDPEAVPDPGSLGGKDRAAGAERRVVDGVRRREETARRHAVVNEVTPALLSRIEPGRLAEQAAKGDALEQSSGPRAPVEQRLVLADQDPGAGEPRGARGQPRGRVVVAVDPHDVVPPVPDLADDVPVRPAPDPAAQVRARGARAHPGAVAVEERRPPRHRPSEPGVVERAGAPVRVVVDGQVHVRTARQLPVQRHVVLDGVGDEVRDPHGPAFVFRRRRHRRAAAGQPGRGGARERWPAHAVRSLKPAASAFGRVVSQPSSVRPASRSRSRSGTTARPITMMSVTFASIWTASRAPRP